MIRPTRSLAALALLGLVGVTACGGDDDGGSADTTAEDSVPEETPVAGATGDAVDCDAGAGETVTVEIGDFEFLPERVEVSTCDEIVWSNVHTQPHTATGNGDFSWSTGNVAQGASAEAVVFDTPGEFAYLCALHPFMEGVVEVA